MVIFYLPESFPVFDDLCIILMFVTTHIDNEMFSDFGLLLKACSKICASEDPPNSCFSSTDPW